MTVRVARVVGPIVPSLPCQRVTVGAELHQVSVSGNAVARVGASLASVRCVRGSTLGRHDLGCRVPPGQRLAAHRRSRRCVAWLRGVRSASGSANGFVRVGCVFAWLSGCVVAWLPGCVVTWWRCVVASGSYNYVRAAVPFTRALRVVSYALRIQGLCELCELWELSRIV